MTSVKTRKILYCGDSPVGGAANYLLGVLNDMKATATHVDPAKKLSPALLAKDPDLVILSDYPACQASPAAQKALVNAVQARGTGLLMLGGWASYSGPFGGWRGTPVETLLPVRCAPHDDRTNFPGGAVIQPTSAARVVLPRLGFLDPPALCGFNAFLPKPGSTVVLKACPLRYGRGGKVTLDRRGYPLLVVRGGTSRSAALATDLAPHWCGGLVDWGHHHRRLPVAPGMAVEVGRDYIRFVTALISWVARAS